MSARLPPAAITPKRIRSRGGPSTGVLTKPEQADPFAAAFSAHGETVRPILAPISVADIFGVTVEAFNIAVLPSRMLFGRESASSLRSTWSAVRRQMFADLSRATRTAATP